MAAALDLEAWSDTYDEGYIHQFYPGPTQKIH